LLKPLFIEAYRMSNPRDEKNLYKVLGIDKGADKEEVRRAYKKLSMKYHPDKGGSEEDFKAIARAHDTLSDDRKRQIYDSTGSVDGEGGEQQQPQGFPGGFPFVGMPGGMPGGMPFDFGSMFNMFGAGGPQGGQPTGPRVRKAKAPPKIHEIPLTLHDFYHGRKIQIQFERQKFCSSCKGEGCKSFVPCGPCNGRGVLEHIVQIAPGMNIAQRGPCGHCNAEGRAPGPQCGTCKGKKFSTHEKSLDVEIKPGMKVKEVLVFEKECSDNHEYLEAGDVHIVLTEADDGSHPFKRDGNHLLANIQLNLTECLLGCQKTFSGHPGYTEGLVLNLPPGIMSGTTYSAEGKGMPRRPDGGHGNLLCSVKVVVTEAEREKLNSQSALIRGIFNT
jgi:DnaJ-class molecular chaperone